MSLDHCRVVRALIQQVAAKALHANNRYDAEFLRTFRDDPAHNGEQGKTSYEVALIAAVQ